MKSALLNIENKRKLRIFESSLLHKQKFGQYITPISIAKFMSDIMPTDKNSAFTILDPGAGIGTLSYTLISKIIKADFESIELDCYEIDKSILPYINDTFEDILNSGKIDININDQDFILDSTFKIGFNMNKKYTHVIMNPPYKKIKSNSDDRRLLRSIGIETVNLYSAFLAISINMLAPDGYLCAIVPRSFCNGLYYLPFRKYLFNNISIKRIHLFNSRTSSFKDEAVLQENIIILLQKNKNSSDVLISRSENDSFTDYREYYCNYHRIINQIDEHYYINIPESNDSDSAGKYKISNSLLDIGLSVSTGPIVDFRVKEYLEAEYKNGIVPLIYPVHLKHNRLQWPVVSKKPNAIRAEREDISKTLFSKGNYVLVRRFSSKEEKRRVVASILREDDFISDKIAIENHLNIFHINKGGLKIELAYGLMLFLNSEYFDRKFRQFSGHTQVNSTDLKNMKYPSVQKLIDLGERYMFEKFNFSEIDKYIF